MLSSRPSVSKPHDNSVKREQNPHYSHYNGLIVAKAVPGLFESVGFPAGSE